MMKRIAILLPLLLLLSWPATAGGPNREIQLIVPGTVMLVGSGSAVSTSVIKNKQFQTGYIVIYTSDEGTASTLDIDVTGITETGNYNICLNTQITTNRTTVTAIGEHAATDGADILKACQVKLPRDFQIVFTITGNTFTVAADLILMSD